MSETQTLETQRNSSFTATAVASVVFIIAGWIIATVANNALQTNLNVDQLGATLVGGTFDPSNLATPTVWFWGGVILAIVGGVLALACVIIKAARK